eukprot:TRINITY_DN3133_c0_g1_i31.p1 TRINITY_DN3133_c0_g1~~TRINITY_DN3133_c0_g1_i31.p1  ORF type:complete len:325 (-),score=63.09 TRINITY_DN3133_c0_g1_i31:433-1407(-)
MSKPKAFCPVRTTKSCPRHWNPSVNKLCSTVLEIFRSIDLETFDQASKQYWLSRRPPVKRFEEATNKRLQELYPISSRQTVKLPVPTKLSSVDYHHFVFGQILGYGSFSTVRYAKLIERNSLPSTWPEYCIKILNRQLINSQKYLENVKREIELLSSLDHPNIIKLVTTFSNDTNIYMVMDYADKGDLHTAITNLGSLSVESSKGIIAQIINSLEYLHGKGIIYGDLKPENVLLTESGNVLLADFGSARLEEHVKEGDRIEGTREYIAPEVAQGKKATCESDLWALGCVIYQTIVGRLPVWVEQVEVEETTSSVRFSQGLSLLL